MGTPFTVDNAKLWLDGYDLSGDSNHIEGIAGIRNLVADVFGQSGTRRKSGLRSLRLSARGYWDTAAAGSQFKPDGVLFDNCGLSDVPMSFSQTSGGAEGEIAYSAKAGLADYTIQGQVGEFLSFAVEARGSGGLGLIRATVMHNATRSATANGTVRQLGAVGAQQKLVAVLHVIDHTGTNPTLDVKVQSDDAGGFGSPTDRITFAQKTQRSSEFAAPVSGPITDDQWRVSWTIGGTAGPSFLFVVLVGIVNSLQ